METATGLFNRLNRVLSKASFDSYKYNGCANNEALARYVWNTALCEALYPSFQILEVGFRNAVHLELSRNLKDSNWLMNGGNFLYEGEKSVIESARRSLMMRTCGVTEDFLVAEMNFGFWTSLLDARYETVWHKIIANVFPHMPRAIRTRGEASKLMNTVRRLRNAASHHHSIWHWKDLPSQHEQMHILIRWICPSIGAMAAEIDRFPNVYKVGHAAFEKIAAVISKQGGSK